jgi:hypothetical protein
MSTCPEENERGKFNIDCNNLTIEINKTGLDDMQFAIVHRAACIFYNAVGETVAVSVQSQVVEMVMEILGLPFPPEEKKESEEEPENKGLINAAVALGISPLSNLVQIENGFQKTLEKKLLEQEQGEAKQKTLESLNNETEREKILKAKNELEESYDKRKKGDKTAKVYVEFQNALRHVLENNLDFEVSNDYIEPKDEDENKEESKNQNNENPQEKTVTNNININKGGGKHSKTIRSKPKHSKNLRKTQKGGISDKELADLNVPEFFWNQVKEPLQKELSVIIAELINCEMLREYVINAVINHNFDQIKTKEITNYTRNHLEQHFKKDLKYSINDIDDQTDIMNKLILEDKDLKISIDDIDD